MREASLYQTQHRVWLLPAPCGGESDTSNLCSRNHVRILNKRKGNAPCDTCHNDVLHEGLILRRCCHVLCEAASASLAPNRRGM